MSNWIEDSDRKEQRELNYDTLKEVGKILALCLVGSTFSYDSEWETGKWITNCKLDDFESLVNDLDSNFEYVIGPPKPTSSCPMVDYMVGMGLIGVYRLSEESKPKLPKTKIIADAIRGGQMAGDDWSIDIDYDRVDNCDLLEIVKTIAGFVEDGITQGMNPYWKLTIDKTFSSEMEKVT